MKKVRIFALGLVIGLLLTTGVFAANDRIQAAFVDFKLSINGELQQLQHKPILYNGTTYLPVRELANLLSYDVGYKSNTKTILLNKNKNAEHDGSINKKPMNTHYEIGEKIQWDGFEIKITSFEYMDRVNLIPTDRGEKFAVVNFDIYTDTTPENNFYWAATDFITDFKMDSKTITRRRSIDEKTTIYPYIQNNTMVFTSIPIDKKVTSIAVYNPITKEKVEVVLN